MLGLVAAACVASPATFPEGPERVAVEGYADHLMEPALSRDGEILVFNNRNDPPARTDLHWARRTGERGFRYGGPIVGANSPTDLDGVGSLAADGRFCFVSTRDYAATLATVRCGMFLEGQARDVTLQPGCSPQILGRLIFDVELTARGDMLLVADGLFRGGAAPVRADLRLCRRNGESFVLSPGDDALFAAVNTGALEYAPAISADGRRLVFTRMTGRPPFVATSLWLSERPNAEAPFGPPVRISAAAGFVEAATFAPDGRTLYFHRLDRGRFTLMRLAL